MIDWKQSMQQTFEFFVVNPLTWKDEREVTNIKSCTINRDATDSTRAYATIESTDAMEECYLRIYLVAIQNGEKERVPLGTFLVQTPSVKFDGKVNEISMDAYSPLIELKEKVPPIGYTIMKNEPIMKYASTICRENLRAPVVATESIDTLNLDFVANLDDTWMTFIEDLVSNAKHELMLDELGRVLFSPIQETAALQWVWTYDDDNSSILYPDIEDERDLYGIPNVVEVVYSENNRYVFSRVVNDDPNSPISTVNRGREVIHRDSSPSIQGTYPTQTQVDEYATQLLKSLSSLEHTLTYSHGYCPVRVGDCVLLDYRRSGIRGIKAKVTSQSIKCETGCTVEETAVYTTQLWR